MVRGLREAECRIWWCTLTTEMAPLYGLLDQRELVRAERLRHPPARARFTLGRAAARLLVSECAAIDPTEVEFRATCRHCGGGHGRLEVHTDTSVLHVSVAHSGDRVAVAVAAGVVCGVDVERVALRGGRPPVTALSATEREVLAALPEDHRLTAFIRYWTRKEAILKATGDGLIVAPSALTVSAPDAAPDLLEWANRPGPRTRVHLTDLTPGPGYRGALATLGEPLSVVERRVDPVTDRPGER